jgi:hypothetical protein
MSRQELDRRGFLKQLGLAAAFGLGAQSLAGCGSKTQDPCSDLSGLSAQDQQTRITYGYRNQTLIEAKRCDNCNFWKAPAGGGPCGSCTLVKGPISPGGYCNSWAQPVPPGQAAPPVEQS